MPTPNSKPLPGVSYTPDTAIVQYRLAILYTETQWRNLTDALSEGRYATDLARKHFEEAVISESCWAAQVWEHIHQIDCCSNKPENEDPF